MSHIERNNSPDISLSKLIKMKIQMVELMNFSHKNNFCENPGGNAVLRFIDPINQLSSYDVLFAD